jgi:hypothetical protein
MWDIGYITTFFIRHYCGGFEGTHGCDLKCHILCPIAE